MKIQCDVCGRAEAAVYCTADEAALCSACDHRVHHANKLASKHRRFSLLSPSPHQFPLCDICQEKRAFLFCQQDRAILCRDCDHPIHAANEHTQKHSRFLLTGVKLSNASELYHAGSEAVPVPDPKAKPAPTPNQQPKSSAIPSGNLESSAASSNGGLISSISEYLIETLPGWHVEDFLDNCKADDGMLVLDESCNGYSASSFTSENMGVWVPQAPIYQSEMGKETTNPKALNGSFAASTRWSDDGAFTVPQMKVPSSSSGSKRSRTFW